MVKEQCHRCARPVYPTDIVGPLKDCVVFHRGCFKCYICGTRLALTTYCNNRSDINDREIYCNNHVPLAGPHEPSPRNERLLANSLSNGKVHESSDRKMYDAGLNDLKIAHAIKATQVAKPYPKITHNGAKYIVDYDTQTRLELIHRSDEDDLYSEFKANRKREEHDFEKETKEEWEKALNEFARKYQQCAHISSGSKSKDELIHHLTMKRDEKRETLRNRRKERERTQTAEMVDKQAKEMLDLFKQARRNGVTASVRVHLLIH